MLNLRFIVRMLSVGLMVLGAGVVSGQDYPNKPIRIVTTGAGGTSDFVARLGAELFKSMAAVDLVGVPYKASAQPITAVIGNEVQLYFAPVISVMPHAKAGRLRALAVTSAQPSLLAPGLPTVAASVPGYESISISAIFVPAKTPVAIINRSSQEIVRFLNQAEVKERVFNAGTELVASSPEQLAATITSEIIRLGKVIKGAGIKIDE
ncbi:MAG: hypothetical protein A3G24_22150 [Betaproteobacteria bacterium RIFCSPLOWO2_12_FULL_62_13]|nr:MAG: hypothetical protein A3G24_22150 [Betaproteobacteria bacterium RIFCSPLOWO2_12_FULL_62_13]